MALKASPVCSFCNETAKQVGKLIAGTNAYICDNCVNLCTSMLDDELRPTEPRFDITEQQMFCATLQNYDAATVDKMRAWIDENEMSAWVKTVDKNEFMYKIIFENESDLVAFKLRWI